MISHKHKCIFIHIPKCAGTSVERVLGHLDGHQGRGGQDHRSIRMIERPFVTANMLASKDNCSAILRRIHHRYRRLINVRNRHTVTREQYESYYKFTIVRNPWARAFSWYKNVMRDDIHKKKHNISGDLAFKDFLRAYAGKGMLRTQMYWIKGFNGSVNLDYIGRFESLAEDFQRACMAMGEGDLTLSHEIGGHTEHYSEHYDKKSIALISDVYREEIELFEYSFALDA